MHVPTHQLCSDDSASYLSQSIRRILRWVFVCSVLWVLSAPTHAQAVASPPMTLEPATPSFSVAIKPLTYESPLSSRPLPLMVWYPTQAQEEQLLIGQVSLRVARNTKPRDGLYPLVVLSHGSMGSHLSHWKTAYFLASKGYFVATPVHALDNAIDPQGSSTIKVWANRPREWNAALDAVLNSELAGSVNRHRVVAMGFSAGAYTALVVGGAQPSSSALDRYCQVHPRHDVACVNYGVVTRWWAQVRQKLGQPRELLQPVESIRANAVIAMAPVGEAMFTAEGIKRLQLPTLLLQGNQDTILSYPNDARYLRDQLTSKTDYYTVPGGHYVFLSVRTDGSRTTANADGLMQAHRLILSFLTRLGWTSPP